MTTADGVTELAGKEKGRPLRGLFRSVIRKSPEAAETILTALKKAEVDRTTTPAYRRRTHGADSARRDTAVRGGGDCQLTVRGGAATTGRPGLPADKHKATGQHPFLAHAAIYSVESLCRGRG